MLAPPSSRVHPFLARAVGCALLSTTLACAIYEPDAGVTGSDSQESTIRQIDLSLWDNPREPRSASSGGITDIGTQNDPMPFRTVTIDATESALVAAIHNLEGTDRWNAAGIESNLFDRHKSVKCHTQGISVVGNDVVTSCMSNNNKKSKRTGYLQYYRLGRGTMNKFKYGDSSASKMVEVYRNSDQGDELPYSPHAVVGQGAMGVRVGDFSKYKGKYLVPVVSESNYSGDNTGPARVDLRDKNGATRYSFQHQPHKDDSDIGLAAASLLTADHDGRPMLYLLTISKHYFYVYRFHFSTFPSNGQWFHHHQRLFAAKAQNMMKNGAEWPKPTSSSMAYQSIAFLTATDTTGSFPYPKRMYMYAGHDEWLDLYELETTTDAERAEDPSLHRLMLRKLTKREFPKPNRTDLFKRGLFYEGLSLERSGPRGLHIWAAPMDYKRIHCDPGVVSDVTKCTDIFRLRMKIAEPTPQPPDCTAGVVGCPCADVDHDNIYDDENTRPDGNYSIDKFCPDDEDGTAVVCSKKVYNAGQIQGECMRCNTWPLPAGCPCTSDDDCDNGDTCYGEETWGGGATGTCLSVSDPPNWTCLADCKTLFNDEKARCDNYHPSGGHCFDQNCDELAQNQCGKPGACSDGECTQLCDENEPCPLTCSDGSCELECLNTAECHAKGYPPGFECSNYECVHPIQQ